MRPARYYVLPHRFDMCYRPSSSRPVRLHSANSRNLASLLDLMAAMTRSDCARVQTHLRALLNNPTLVIDPTQLQGGTAQLRIGDNVLGTVDQMDEQWERSWAVTLIVLADDLAA